MKRIILSLTILVMSVCTALADDDKPITIDQLPVAAKQFIGNYFSAAKVSYAKKETELFDKSYKVIFTNGNKVEFNNKGEWKEVDCKFTQVPEGVIPRQIRNHVATNYKDIKIVEIDRD